MLGRVLKGVEKILALTMDGVGGKMKELRGRGLGRLSPWSLVFVSKEILSFLVLPSIESTRFPLFVYSELYLFI